MRATSDPAAPLTDAERECVEVCTSSCHAGECDHHGFIAARATSTPAGLREALDVLDEAEEFNERSHHGPFYGGWKRAIEHARVALQGARLMTDPAAGLRIALEDLRDNGYQPSYNGRPSCPFCLNFVDDAETHVPGCRLVAALQAEAPEPRG